MKGQAVHKRPAGRRGRASIALLAFAALALSSPPAAGAAGPPQALWQRCDGGSEDVSCNIPRGIGVKPVNGNLYLSDQSNHRIVELTAWGEFLRTWGWGVADNSPAAQICTVVANCLKGSEGGGAGQFGLPNGIAVDTAGNVYVFDFIDNRVQKFDSEGHFLLMFGGEVNKTKTEEGGSTEAQRNLCTAASGDVCQKGTAGAGKGQFNVATPTSSVVIGPASTNRVYVGDKGRIQVFDTEGHYVEDISNPEILPGNTVKSLASGPLNGGVGTLYVALQTSAGTPKANVVRLKVTGPKVGNECAVAKPTALAMATDSAGIPTGNLYVYDEATGQARQFSSACAEVKESSFAKGEVTSSTGIAVGTACFNSPGSADVYLSDSLFGSSSFVRAYGAAPDNTGLCHKPELAPEILTEYAVSVGASEAQLRAQINPRFYADTEYQVQYGTAACVEGGFPAPPAPPSSCVKEQPLPLAVLGAPAVDFPFTSSSVFLAGLAPATPYRYRFVAKSLGGGPTLGVEHGFKTFPLPAGGGPCLNAAFRSGASALLPDCRAYEMVSPIDKEGGDILVQTDASAEGRLAERIQSAESGDRFTYSSFRAFGDAQSAPYTSQYMAERGPGGWSNQNISPPRGVGFGGLFPGSFSEFQLFSPDLCSAWLDHYAGTAAGLAPSAVPFNLNIYRRSDCGAAEGGYEALSKVVGGSQIAPVKGLSADGGVAIFRDQGRLTQDAPVAATASEANALNCGSPVPQQATSRQWLRDGAAIVAAGIGTLTSGSKAVSAVITANGIGTLTSGSKAVSAVTSASGRFLAGQTITGTGIPANATIARVLSPTELELSAAATASGSQSLSAGAQPFAVGWSISGAGIPAGTTIAAVSKQTLTLSANATASASGVALSAAASVQTYTISPEEDAGQTIQCRMTVGSGGGGSTQVANPAWVIAPYPSTAPPLAPAQIPAPSASGPLAVGGGGGQTLSCDPGAWEGSPSFAYQWYRNGVALVGNGANTPAYTVQTADLASAAYFQCEASAENAGGTVVETSEPLATDPVPPAPVARPNMTGQTMLYVASGKGGLRAVCVLPGGTQSNGCAAGTASGEQDGRSDLVMGALSADGSRAFWSNSPAGLGRLYERLNPTAPQSALALGQATGAGVLASGSNEVKELRTASGGFAVGQTISGAGIPFGTTIAGLGAGTLTLSANATETTAAGSTTALAATSECTEAQKACTLGVSEAVENPENRSRFWAASADGAKVLFGSGPTGEHGEDLYEFDVATRTPTLIAHEAFGVLGASKDLSRIYFVSKEKLVLTSGAQPGQPNLYLRRAGGPLSFVATLSGTDAKYVNNNRRLSPANIQPYLHGARVSDDGESAAFISTAALIPSYDNADLSSGEADAEVYHYDASTGKLACASCDPSGARPVGQDLGVDVEPFWVAAKLPNIENELYASHVLSEDGSRLFFESFGPLVPGDTNGKQDVYEWEAPGSGSCSEASPSFSSQDEGCVNLISSGESPQDSTLLDASPEGKDVFIKTGSSLVSQDPGQFDVYDARAEGGFPPPPSPQPPCEGEACQSPPPPPAELTPASSVFQGAENQKPRKRKHKQHKHRHRRAHRNQGRAAR